MGDVDARILMMAMLCATLLGGVVVHQGRIAFEGYVELRMATLALEAFENDPCLLEELLQRPVQRCAEQRNHTEAT